MFSPHVGLDEALQALEGWLVHKFAKVTGCLLEITLCTVSDVWVGLQRSACFLEPQMPTVAVRVSPTFEDSKANQTHKSAGHSQS